MKIEKLAAYSTIPSTFEDAQSLTIPENTVLLYHILTDHFNSPNTGCTSDANVWFPSPLKIVFMDSPLRMIVVVNQESVYVPIEAGKCTVEFAVLSQT